jgi:hypothetical protein
VVEVTVDELIDLTQGLLDDAGFNLSSLRETGAPALLTSLGDEQFLLAVRFAAGERPAVTTAGPLVDPEPPRRRERKLVPLDDDEYAERLARLEELDEETPRGPIDIGDGITLP